MFRRHWVEEEEDFWILYASLHNVRRKGGDEDASLSLSLANHHRSTVRESSGSSRSLVWFAWKSELGRDKT